MNSEKGKEDKQPYSNPLSPQSLSQKANVHLQTDEKENSERKSTEDTNRRVHALRRAFR